MKEEYSFRILCPDCGHDSFNVQDGAATLENYVGAVCNGCGYVITQTDIDKALERAKATIQADVMAELKGAFAKAGFKLK